jgi:endonuclease III
MDERGPSLKHMVSEEEEKKRENPAPPCPTPHKDALMLLSVLDSVLSASNTDDRTAKSMDKLQNFVPKVYNMV